MMWTGISWVVSPMVQTRCPPRVVCGSSQFHPSVCTTPTARSGVSSSRSLRRARFETRIRWAFSRAELVDPDTGEVKDVILSPSADDDMLRHYGVGAAARVFRSVTPVALPEEGKRRRIEPTRKLTEAKRGLERVLEISGARAAEGAPLARRDCVRRAGRGPAIAR